MEFLFEKCENAIKNTNETKTFGMFHSDKQNPDLSIHLHECCELLLCVSGGKSFLIDDKVYDVHDGDLFIINQFEAHKITSDPNAVFSRFVLQIHPEFMFSYSSELTDLSRCFYYRGYDVSNKYSLKSEETEYLKGLFNQLRESNDYGDDIIKKTVAIRILVYVNQLFENYSELHNDLYNVENSTIKHAISYINNNYGTDLSLDVIAKNSFVSVNQLCRLFKKHCGTTVSKYIVSKRIMEAKKLLISGKSVTDTAILCGFNDYANFIRVFKYYVGTPPGKYKFQQR